MTTRLFVYKSAIKKSLRRKWKKGGFYRRN